MLFPLSEPPFCPRTWGILPTSQVGGEDTLPGTVPQTSGPRWSLTQGWLAEPLQAGSFHQKGPLSVGAPGEGWGLCWLHTPVCGNSGLGGTCFQLLCPPALSL